MKNTKNNMTFKYNELEYQVEIIKKNNKNTYIRVKDNKIYVTTNYFVSNKSIKKLIDTNYSSITKMLDKEKQKEERNKIFLLFGKQYDIIYNNTDKIRIEDNIIYTKDEKTLNAWLNKFIKTTYQNHLNYWYEKFEEPIPIPNLKIRKMKTRWGVCNTKNHNVTLNLELFKYEIECLDYVIVHELSHFIEANHSKNFWKVVEKYYPNYKEIRKKLKD